jgi:hypothetical protein
VKINLYGRLVGKLALVIVAAISVGWIPMFVPCARGPGTDYSRNHANGTG